MGFYKSDNADQEMLVDIAPDGDCILVVGPDMVKIRVHSRFLRVASRPFSAMFTPKWKEGDTFFGQAEPKEIDLPEDDATSIQLICAIIHHQNHGVPVNLSARDILGVAIAADKYDCVLALRFASETWFGGHNEEADDQVVLAAAAYLLWNGKAFRDITKTMILTHDGPYYKLCSAEVESVMDWKVFCMLEEARDLARLKLANILIKGADDPTGSCVHKCGWSSKYAFAYLQELEKQDLWPIGLSRQSISKAVKTVSRMPDPIPRESSASCQYSYKHCAPEYRRHRQWGLEDLDKNVGLCLNCIRKGEDNALNCQGTCPQSSQISLYQ